MERRMGPSRKFRHVFLATFYFTTSATALSHSTLFHRASTCADPTYNQCTQAGLPSNFCCPPGDACISLAANTTVLCCPPGANCTSLQPITCDLSIQNAAIYPNNTLKTTALTGTLPTCNGKCCPFGYDCDGSNCIMKADQRAVVPVTSTSSSSSSPTTFPSFPSTSSNPSASSSSNTTLPSTLSSTTCPHFPTTAVLIGFFPGLLLGIFLTLTTLYLLSHRRSQQSNHNHNHPLRRRRTLSSFGFNNISEPQPTSGDMRTDFLRKQMGTPSTTDEDGIGNVQRRATVNQRVRSLFQRSYNAGGLGGTMAARENGGDLPPPVPLVVRTGRAEMRPVTPAAQREPSFVDIDIFTDGDTASALRGTTRKGSGRETRTGTEIGDEEGLRPEGLRHGKAGLRESHQTTFTDMMERSGLAGLRKGEAYVYKGSTPGRT